MKETSNKTVRAFLLLLAVALCSLVAGCDDTSTVVSSGGEKDSGWNVGDDVDTGEDGGDSTDSGPSVERQMTESNHLCAAAGTATGDGYSVTHCTAPAQPAGPSLVGEAYNIEVSGFHIIH